MRLNGYDNSLCCALEMDVGKRLMASTNLMHTNTKKANDYGISIYVVRCKPSKPSDSFEVYFTKEGAKRHNNVSSFLL